MKTMLLGKVLALLVISELLGLWAPHQVSAAVHDWQKGATFAPTATNMFEKQEFRDAVGKLKGDGVNTIVLVIPYCQPSADSTDIRPCWWNTPTYDSLASAADHIHSQGMNVVYEMHPEMDSGEWRAFINPSNRDEWFAKYGDILSAFAKHAAEHNVHGMVIGAEMLRLTDQDVPGTTEHWRELIARVRTDFHGFITYGMQWDGENAGFLADLDYIGLSAYAPVGTTADASVDDMKQSWKAWDDSRIKTLQQTYHKPIIFTEVGYKSVSGTNLQPWMSWLDGPVNEDAQVTAYEAMFSYWDADPDVRGVYLWDFKADPSAGGPGNPDYTPQNKKAEEVMRRWFN